MRSEPDGAGGPVCCVCGAGLGWAAVFAPCLGGFAEAHVCLAGLDGSSLGRSSRKAALSWGLGEPDTARNPLPAGCEVKTPHPYFGCLSDGHGGFI